MVNVLLMLSSRVDPDPLKEVRWHAERCHRDGVTFLATNQRIQELNSGLSKLALYGDSDQLDNRLLARATYQDRIPYPFPRANQILAGSDLYQNGNVPRNLIYFIELTDFILADEAATIDDLNGIMIPTQLPLNLVNLPVGQNRAKVDYRL